MTNANYGKGRRYEYRAKKSLESMGYTVIRAAGSHGPFDLVAIGEHGNIALQVKADCKISTAELEKLHKIKTTHDTLKQIWSYSKGKLDVIPC
jgi:Holliday junction resolvase